MFTLGRVTIAVALAGVFFGSPAVHRADARTASSQARCTNVQLSITPGPEQGAAGHIGILYRMHNLQSSSCILYGYPGVQLLDRSFQDLPTNLHRGGVVLNGRRTPTTVSVPGHGDAWFVILYRNVPAANGSCTMATYLMIFPPNAFLPVVAYAAPGRASVRACAGQIQVSPVTAGHAGF